MKIALAQIFCDWGNVRANLQRSLKYIRIAGKKGADLVVFPETSVHGMWKNHLVRLAAEPLNGPIVKQMAGWARKYQIAIGFGLAEKTTGKPYNSYILMNSRGKIAGVYRKNYITVLEKDYFRKDLRRPIFKLGNLRIGIAICADCHHPQLLKSYSRRGANIVLMPHAWDADPILKGGKIAVWKSEEHMVDSYARGKVKRYRTHNEMLKFFADSLRPTVTKCGFYAAFVNPVGQSHPLIPFVGPAFVMDRQGKVITRSKSKKEQLLLADIPLACKV